MIEEKIIFSCEDHIEIALDDFINETDMAPQMIKVSDDNNEKCIYCEKYAKYIILK